MKEIYNILFFYLTSIAVSVYAGALVYGGPGIVLGLLLGHYGAKFILSKGIK